MGNGNFHFLCKWKKRTKRCRGGRRKEVEMRKEGGRVWCARNSHCECKHCGLQTHTAEKFENDKAVLIVKKVNHLLLFWNSPIDIYSRTRTNLLPCSGGNPE